MKILHLTLKKKWFDMILSGEKKDEYREIKPYWEKRLLHKYAPNIMQYRNYDAIQFTNGYSLDSPTFLIELIDIDMGKGKQEWGAPNKDVFILKLGKILK